MFTQLKTKPTFEHFSNILLGCLAGLGKGCQLGFGEGVPAGVGEGVPGGVGEGAPGGVGEAAPGRIVPENSFVNRRSILFS